MHRPAHVVFFYSCRIDRLQRNKTSYWVQLFEVANDCSQYQVTSEGVDYILQCLRATTAFNVERMPIIDDLTFVMGSC